MITLSSTISSASSTFCMDDVSAEISTDHVIPRPKKRSMQNAKKKRSTVVRVNEFAPHACFSCNEMIMDRYMLQVDDKIYHLDCLRCTTCQKCLGAERSCYVKNEDIYCKQDYLGLFGAKCSKCCRSIATTDWVRKAREHVYHLACFACDTCKRQLSTGEEFTLVTLDNDPVTTLDGEVRLLCKTHYVNSLDSSSSRNKDDNSDSSSSSTGKPKTKRMRTTFTDEQLQVLQLNFNQDSNPDGQDLERIAQMTGLSKRVTQVWFQNSRARQKKHQQQSQRKLNSRQTSQNPLNSSSRMDATSNSVTLQQNQARQTPSPHSSSDNVDSNSHGFCSINSSSFL